MLSEQQRQKEKALMHSHCVSDVLADVKDDRDFTAATVGIACAADIPKEYKLPFVMPVLDQGNVGSCVAHAICTAYGYGEMQLGLKEKGTDYSRGYLYGNRDDDQYQGEGMMPREALKNLHNYGDVLFEDFPYNMPYKYICAKIHDIGRSKLAKLAEQNKIESYFSIHTRTTIQQSLIDTGAVIIYVPIFNDEFTSDLVAPEEKEPKCTGAHEMCVVGWDETGWLVQNSWSEDWGVDGVGHVAFDYPGLDFWSFYVKNPLKQKENKPTKKSILNTIIDFFKSLFAKIFKK